MKGYDYSTCIDHIFLIISYISIIFLLIEAAEGSLMQLEKTWISKTKLQEYGEDIDDEEEEEGDQFEVIDQGGESTNKCLKQIQHHTYE